MNQMLFKNLGLIHRRLITFKNLESIKFIPQYHSLIRQRIIKKQSIVIHASFSNFISNELLKKNIDSEQWCWHKLNEWCQKPIQIEDRIGISRALMNIYRGFDFMQKWYYLPIAIVVLCSDRQDALFRFLLLNLVDQNDEILRKNNFEFESCGLLSLATPVFVWRKYLCCEEEKQSRN